MSAEHDDLLMRIRSRLMQLHPDKVIVFGSHAWGRPDEESDIDLVVVLNKDEAPNSFRQRMENVLSVRSCVADINREVPLDIMVYSRPEWRRFIEQASSFSRDVREKGLELL